MWLIRAFHDINLLRWGALVHHIDLPCVKSSFRSGTTFNARGSDLHTKFNVNISRSFIESGTPKTWLTQSKDT